ncbi:hypothetical protein K2X92_05140 [Candidatus Gracilibacteria bacterium]|nr:hypothetical protein [Candidatus Gracilibacteria bacterium]
MYITSLDALYIVLAVILIPIGTLISMILWRVYSMLDRVERILNFADRVVGYAREFEKIPMMIIEKFMGK